MPISLNKQQLIDIVDGQGTSSSLDTVFNGAEFDTRRMQGGKSEGRPEGRLFVALPGEEGPHGHDYLDIAINNGASLCLVEDEALLRSSKFADKLVAVSSTIEAFGLLATYQRERIGAPVIGVTGSIGKTTTKSILRSILEEIGNGTASEKSFNNHIGVPYTLCQTSENDSWVVLEMGMNHSGELTELSNIACPDVVLITGIAPAHMEFFASINEVAQAKLEIISGLKSDGVLLLNGDDEVLLGEYQKLTNAPKKVEFFGKTAGTSVRILSVESKGLAGFSAKFELRGEEFEAILPLLGSYNVINAAAAILAATTLLPDISVETIRQGLSKVKPAPMRLEVINVSPELTIISDCYNASPKSMAASVGLLAELKKPEIKVGAVLGDMRELGDEGKKQHREIGQLVAEKGIDLLIAVGELGEEIGKAAEEKGIEVLYADEAKQAGEMAKKYPDVSLWLVKASRGMKLEGVIETILN